MNSCDLCGPAYTTHELTCPNTMFRKVRKVCYECLHQIEMVRMRHAHDAYKYGGSDWHARLCRNVKRDLKKLYRRIQRYNK